MMKERQSEPTRLGEILPGVMKEIESRVELNETETISPTSEGHQVKVFEAVGDFMTSKKRKRTLCGV